MIFGNQKERLLMLEFDFSKPYEMLGCDGTMFYIQDGLKYLPKKNKPPELVKQRWAKRTVGGGQVFTCRFCKTDFPNSVSIGRHYKNSPCTEKIVQYHRDRSTIRNSIMSERTLQKILEG